VVEQQHPQRPHQRVAAPSTLRLLLRLRLVLQLQLRLVLALQLPQLEEFLVVALQLLREEFLVVALLLRVVRFLDLLLVLLQLPLVVYGEEEAASLPRLRVGCLDLLLQEAAFLVHPQQLNSNSNNSNPKFPHTLLCKHTWTPRRATNKTVSFPK